MDEVKKVYKAVRDIEGRLESLVVGSKHFGKSYRDEITLTYKEGEITYAPENSAGIWTHSNLRVAVTDIYNWNLREEGACVYEAIPLGKALPAGTNDGCVARYPAILLGKCVWRSEPEKPEEEWEDITRECKMSPYLYSIGGEALVNISYHGECVAMLGINGVEVSNAMEGGRYALAEETIDTAQGTLWFKVLKRC